MVSYGAPISISSEWVQSYAQGGPAKREAIAALLEAGYEGLKSVTVNAPNYDTLMVSWPSIIVFIANMCPFLRLLPQLEDCINPLWNTN